MKTPDERHGPAIVEDLPFAEHGGDFFFPVHKLLFPHPDIGIQELGDGGLQEVGSRLVEEDQWSSFIRLE